MYQSYCTGLIIEGGGGGGGGGALLPFLFVCITIATVIFWVLERKCQARAMGSWEETVI